MNELTTINVTNLTNKKLASQLTRYNKAINGVETNRWAAADAIHNIMSGELYKDDYESDKKFADAIGLHKGQLSKLNRAADYKDSIVDSDEVRILIDWNLSKVFELLVLTKEDAVACIEKYGMTANTTVKEIRENVAQFKSDKEIDEAIEVEARDVDAEETEDTSKDSFDVETIETVAASIPTAISDGEVKYIKVDLTTDDIVEILKVLKKRGVING